MVGNNHAGASPLSEIFSLSSTFGSFKRIRAIPIKGPVNIQNQPVHVTAQPEVSLITFVVPGATFGVRNVLRYPLELPLIRSRVHGTRRHLKQRAQGGRYPTLAPARSAAGRGPREYIGEKAQFLCLLL